MKVYLFPVYKKIIISSLQSPNDDKTKEKIVRQSYFIWGEMDNVWDDMNDVKKVCIYFIETNLNFFDNGVI